LSSRIAQDVLKTMCTITVRSKERGHWAWSKEYSY